MISFPSSGSSLQLSVCCDLDTDIQRPTMGELARFDICLGELFDTISSDMVDDYWADEPDLRLQHVVPMSRFIQSSVPHKTLFQEQKNAFFENSKADVMQDIVDECVRMVSGAIDIYVRRFIEKDFTAAYFLKARCFAEACEIAWIVNEIKVCDAEKCCCITQNLQPGDTAFNFCSSDYSWKCGFGERGILVVRKNQIVSRTILEVS